MNMLYIFFIILGIIFLFILIFGLPRKKSIRRPNIEGLDEPEVAKAFEKMTNFLPYRILHKKVLKQIKKLKPRGRLLDVGCGSGNLIIKIAEAFPHLELLGVDISIQILKFAQNKVNKSSLRENIDFKEGSVEDLPFPDESIDFVVSTLSLHHWHNPKIAFQEFYRILKKDGIALIFDFRRDSRKIFYSLFTFATKIVVPKALKQLNEPLGSIKSSYTPAEVKQMVFQNLTKSIKISPFLSWMFIIIKK